MADAHAKAYGASNSATWLPCPGSVALSEGKPGSSSSYAREGTAAHALAEMCLTQNKDAVAFIGDRIPVEHETIEADDDMARYVQEYVDLVRGLRDTLGATLLVEQRLQYGPLIGIEDPESGWGTGDAVLLAGNEICIADLKFGRGEQVAAEGNTQLQLYALGAWNEYKDYGDFDTVRVIISQPRNGGTSEWTISVADLLVFAEEAKAAVQKAEQARACEKRDAEWEAVYLNPGEKQCRWCKAKATCPELRNTVARTVFDTTPATPEDFEAYTSPVGIKGMTLGQHVGMLPIDWLAACMSKADLIEDWLTAIRAETERRLLAGEPVQGFKLVKGKQGNRAWASATEAEEALKAARLKRDEMYDLKVISPTTAEKLLAKDKPRVWSKLQTLITRSDGKVHVAAATDPREAVVLQASADDFDAIPASDNPADAESFA